MWNIYVAARKLRRIVKCSVCYFWEERFLERFLDERASRGRRRDWKCDKRNLQSWIERLWSGGWGWWRGWWRNGEDDGDKGSVMAPGKMWWRRCWWRWGRRNCWRPGNEVVEVIFHVSPSGILSFSYKSFSCWESGTWWTNGWQRHKITHLPISFCIF